MYIDIYGSMHPDHIDYNLIDPPLKKLVKAINKSIWLKTIGCCAGKAYHNDKNFYLFVEVKGLNGIRNLLKWLALSHALIAKTCHKYRLSKGYILSKAELTIPNLLNADHFVSKTLMGKNWSKIAIRFYSRGKQPNKVQTLGGIKALELGWVSLNKYTTVGKGKSLFKSFRQSNFLTNSLENEEIC